MRKSIALFLALCGVVGASPQTDSEVVRQWQQTRKALEAAGFKLSVSANDPESVAREMREIRRQLEAMRQPRNLQRVGGASGGPAVRQAKPTYKLGDKRKL